MLTFRHAAEIVMIAIIDAGLGNIGSIENMLRHLSIPSMTVTHPAQLSSAHRIILPGVGSFDHGMDCLERSGFIPELNHLAASGMPILGICLGFQLMTRRSDEGVLPGLGWLPAETRAFDLNNEQRKHLRIPHMGWSDVSPRRVDDPLLQGERNRFYFTHSYHVVCDDPADIVATAEHGHTITAIACRSNVTGVQFHPEKSHRYGMNLFRRFVGVPDPTTSVK